jgi:hypothetical protein
MIYLTKNNETLNSDGQQFFQYRLNWMTIGKEYDFENSCPWL